MNRGAGALAVELAEPSLICETVPNFLACEITL